MRNLDKRKEFFLSEATKAHNGKYGYELVEYTNAKEKVRIVCPIHGEFMQEPLNHQRGVGCPGCKVDKLRKTFSGNLDGWLKKAQEAHGDRYCYDKSEYVGIDIPITITCRLHGDFKQKPWDHQIGKGCPVCRYITIANKRKDTLEEFEEKARKVHGDKYDYSRASYKNNMAAINIVCPKHGIFRQAPSGHLSGRGCRKCAQNKPKVEGEIADFLNTLDVSFIENDRQAIKPYELDFYFPDRNLAIEFCGLYWHQEDFIGANYHKEKLERCQRNGIKLIQIFEDEWTFRKVAVKTIIKGALNKINRVAARKTITEFERPLSEETKKFIGEYHHAGNVQANCAVVLKQNGEIVFAASFRRYTQNRKNFVSGEWELARVTSNKRVIGGLSKALSTFYLNEAEATDLYSFCDLRYFDGHGLEKVGFKHLGTTAPTPFYANSRMVRVHQRTFTKANAIKKFGEGYRTAKEAVCSNGYWRIFDCGHKKYHLKRTPIEHNFSPDH